MPLICSCVFGIILWPIKKLRRANASFFGTLKKQPFETIWPLNLGKHFIQINSDKDVSNMLDIIASYYSRYAESPEFIEKVKILKFDNLRQSKNTQRILLDIKISKTLTWLRSVFYFALISWEDVYWKWEPLYSGHLALTDTFLWNRQCLIQWGRLY